MNNQDARQIAVGPLTPEQRQRLECMTAVRALWSPGAYDNRNGPTNPTSNVDNILILTDYLVTGAKP